MHRAETACPLDCPDSCSLVVTVNGGRAVAIDGSERNPVTGGYICAKVRRLPRHVHGEDRILRPAIREGVKGEGRFRDVSWDEALERITSELRRTANEHGGESILPLCYGGSNGLLTQDTTDAALFRRLGASRLARTVCAATSGRAAEGLYGKMPGVAYEDYARARLIVVWGANPSGSGIHLVPFLKHARRDGAKLVVVDPRATPLARRADLHLAIRPGTDLPVALAIHRRLFETGRADVDFLARHTTGADELRRRTGAWTIEDAAREADVPAEAIERLASLYAATSPAVIRCGWGPERNRNGGSATAAILALPAVAGKFGVPGGGYTLSNSAAWSLRTDHLCGPEGPSTRVVNMNETGRVLLHGDPPVRLLFVYNANPLATLPAQEKVRAGLEREDLFTVVFDAVRTDTARYADVLLPATTFLEHHDLARGYGSYVLHRVDPVIPAVGEARPNPWVFAEIARRLGFGSAGGPDASAWVEPILERTEGSSPLNRLRRQLETDRVAVPEFGTRPVQFQTVFPRTPDGKAHLVPADLDAEAPQGLYAYRPDPGTDAFPLALVSPATNRTISSTLGQLVRDEARIRIHPEDAAARGLRSGDAIRVFNEAGEVRCDAEVTGELRPGTVELPKGLWSRHTSNGATANALCPDTLSDLAGGACFNDARVQIEKA